MIGKIYFIDKNGSSTLLGELDSVEGESKKDLINRLINIYWDSRLDCIGCSVETKVFEK